MGAVGQRLRESAQALKSVFANPNLRRLELAWGGSILGTWANSIALIVFAYDQGGATGVGLLGVIRWGPAAVAAPFAAVVGDRYPRERVMLVADVLRAAALGVAAVSVAIDGPAAVVYLVAAFVAVVSTSFEPAQSALLPTLAKTPSELTAANVAASTVESVGIFAGPALGGLLLALTSTEVVFAVTGAFFLWSAFFVSRLRVEQRTQEAPVARGGLRRELLAGFRTIASERRLRLIVGLFGAQTLVYGALTVLIAVTALELLDLGEAGVGYLNSAIGVGGLFGGFLALTLAVCSRLAMTFGLGLVFWGLPILAIGALPDPVATIVLLGVIGVAVTMVDVSGYTLLQRTVPGDVLARVFGVLQSVFVGTIGLGAVLAPLLIEALGIRGALIATGALLPVLTFASWRGLAELDRTGAEAPRELDLLRSVPIFAPLPGATLEHLAARLEPVRIPAGRDVFRQGDPGDRFYVVADGEVDVTIDGRLSAVIEPRGYFGEIALLRDIPRTGTARARTDAELYALERDEFISAVTGHPASAQAADAVIGARLGTLRTGIASV